MGRSAKLVESFDGQTLDFPLRLNCPRRQETQAALERALEEALLPGHDIETLRKLLERPSRSIA